MTENRVPLPMEAMRFCPRCGSDQFLPEEVNSLLCKTCGYHHFFNAAGAVIGIIRNKKGEVLVTQRAFEPYKGMLDLPGGFIMPDETAEAALIRELYEELHVEVAEMNYLYSRPNRYPYSGVIVYTMDVLFEVRVKDLSAIKPGDDVLSYQFVGEDNVNRDFFEIDCIFEIMEKWFVENKVS